MSRDFLFYDDASEEDIAYSKVKIPEGMWVDDVVEWRSMKEYW